MENILIVTGHTYPATSVGNKQILSKLKEKYQTAQISDLQQLYPDFQINIEEERRKLEWADVIIIQSPIFWYSMSSLIMRWIEEVFGHGWAYGTKGHALDGKRVVIGLTAGSTNEDYRSGGKMAVTEEEIVKLIEQIFIHCRMNLRGTVFSGGVFNTGVLDEKQIKAIDLITDEHVKKLVKLIG